MKIKFDVKGRILEGTYAPNGEILIQDDTIGDTGGYYVYIWPKDGTYCPHTNEEVGYDWWFESYDILIHNMQSRNWVIDWDIEMKQQSSVFTAIVTAFLGNIPSNLRKISFEEKKSKIIIMTIFDGESSGDDNKSLHIVETKLRSRFPEYDIEIRMIREDAPSSLTAFTFGTIIYQRKELKTIAQPELDLLSFPDAQVLQMKIDIQNKIICISLDGAYLDKSGGIIIDGGNLNINNWEQLEAKIYSSEGEYINDFDELKDISEFIVSGGQIKLKGFGKAGYWVEYTFSNPEVFFTYSFVK